MSEQASCPHCGFPLATDGHADALASVYGEVHRIREIAESRTTGTTDDRIAELSREVHELRLTVARLRGSVTPLPAPRSPVST
jgi:hypothetical protein